MAYEFLTGLFGKDPDGNPESLTFNQLAERLKAAEGVKLADNSRGKYVPADDFKAKEQELKEIRQQLQTARDTITGYEDPEKAKAAAEAWEKKYNKDTAMLLQQFEDQERRHMEELYINQYKFTSKAARDGVLMEFRKENFTFLHGQFVGADEFIRNLQRDPEYKAAFQTEPTTPAAGDQAPKLPKFSTGERAERGQLAPEMTLSKAMEYKNRYPNADIKTPRNHKI